MIKNEKKRKPKSQGQTSPPKKMKTEHMRKEETDSKESAPAKKVKFSENAAPKSNKLKKKNSNSSKNGNIKVTEPVPDLKVHSKENLFKKSKTAPEQNATLKPKKTFDKDKDGSKFQKKTFNNKKGAPPEKPEDWNEFKKKKKELYLKRKQSKSSYEVIVKAKQIGEKLRVKNLEGGKEVRTKLVTELHELMNGNYVKFVLAHDMARIVQYLLKFGPENIRQEISKEIIPATVTMLQSKYGKFCVKRMLKYGNASTRTATLRATYGHAVKLASHAVSAPVYEYAYSTWAAPVDRFSLTQEFFGDMYRLSKDAGVKHLRDVWRDSGDMKVAALGATKANLARILNKDLLDSGLVQTVLCQFLEECTVEDKAELISQLAPHVVVISNSKDGARVVMQCIWYGTNKDRKVAMKALKEHALALAKHEHGHTVLIALFDSADDTVLLNKLILSDLISHAQELAVDEWGRKVLIWLVTPGDTIHFHPTFIRYIESGRDAANTKKDPIIRRQELLAYSSSELLKKIAEASNVWFEKPSVAVLTLAIIKSGSGDDLENALDSLSKLITTVDWKIQEDDNEILAIESSGLHMTLKKLAQNDKVSAENNKYTFGEAIVKSITSDTVEQWVQYNRGCFLLVILFENASESVQDSLKALIHNHGKLLKKQSTSGAKILLKKLV